MGKLLLICAAAAGGFVTAVAATPEDEQRRAYDRGYSDAQKSVQEEAVRLGFAVWEPGETPDSQTFRWTSRQPRWRELSDRDSDNDRSRSAGRSRRRHENSDPEVG
ncbi:hypothetical protein Pan44_43840 [Caulifigura coniformis]|uniref:Uncharacterized protein n=1 Tax=Caulifigura coniformis TaxID=2527983 RepID=A0A517SJN1_9PLAN|nr:hypothetical protein [Caulifigura coniformis]QDT56331.1 hypothetical protein Pan44_43840 [Caulifigura coniformis]